MQLGCFSLARRVKAIQPLLLSNARSAFRLILCWTGVPLGLAAETEYVGSSGQRAGHARMVLMSDGVVETRSKTGELYGLDRLAQLTLQSA